MARTISDEELQLKRRARRRLIGAIVLVTAIVVVLPMVLDSEPRQPRQEVSVQIPSPDSGVFTSKVVPLPAASEARPAAKSPAEEKKAAAAPASAASVAPAPTPEAAKEAPAPNAGRAETAKPPAPEPAARPKPPTRKPKPASKPGTGKFVVQVIALADAEKAKGMQSQIAAAGIQSYTEVVKTAKGDVTRVRAGPFATRAAAEKAREQLKALGMNGNVTTK
jgi:DedD protein